MEFSCILTFLTIFTLHGTARGFIAYECGGLDNNYTSVSLLDVESCNFEPVLLEEDDVTIQLLQPRKRAVIPARSCKVEVNYVVYYCGMHSHNSIVKGGIVSKVVHITKTQCEEMHRDRTISLYGNRISGLAINDSITTHVNFAGWVSWDGACSSEEFIDGSQNWGRVTATGSIKISLYEFSASIRLDDRQIRFPSGSVCSLDSERCVDNDFGPTFWDTYTSSDCQRDSFHVLYRGLAKRAKVQGRDAYAPPMYIYSVTHGPTIFTLTSQSVQPFCFMHLRKTDHPKLFIQEVKDGNFYFLQEEIAPLDMDMFMYVNTKFLHLEKSLSTQMSSMYREIVHHRCEMDRKILSTKLSLAIVSPMEFAYEYMKGPGYTASILGEVIYIIQCSPVEVTSASFDECTLEMPVSYKNTSLFMRPRSRILQSTGTPTSCEGLLQPKYKINGNWFAITPSLHVATPPQVLAPDSSTNWTYTSAGEYAVAGIYTASQIEKLREQIMAPIERRTKGERFASLLNSEKVATSGLDLNSIISESALKKRMHDFWSGTWGYATSFGNISAGIIGLAFAFKAVKFLIDTFIHAITLKEVYGCTWFVFGSIWDALTTYLLIRASKKENLPSESLGTDNVCTADQRPTLNPDSNRQNHVYPNIVVDTPTHDHFKLKEEIIRNGVLIK